MTPEETSIAAKSAVVHLGPAFGHDRSFAAHAERLGFGDGHWPFYFGGRAGVLGEVDAEVIAAACGFFAPAFVRQAWATAIEKHRLDEIVRADVDRCGKEGGRIS